MPTLSPLKVCLVTPEFPPANLGGLARTVERVARLAAGFGLETHVAHLSVRDGIPPLLDRNRQTSRDGHLVVHRIAVGREPADPAARQAWDCAHTLTLRMMFESLEQLHAQERFDLLHAFFLFPVGYVTALLARRSGVPCLTTLVGDDCNRFVFSPAKVAPLTYALQAADRVVTLSQALADAADALTPLGDKVRVIHNSVAPVEPAWRPHPPGQRPFRVGCAGFFKYSKGLPYLLTAVAGLGQEEPVELALLGGFKRGQQEQFDYWVAELGLGERLRLSAPGSHAQVLDWLRGLDAFALPSLSEGCPNILMEAMACGLPCVAARVGACPELIADGVSGLLVPRGDSAALAAALGQIRDDPAAAEVMGQAARQAMQGFSASAEGRDWRAVYRELLDL
ncbi:MAG: glycosyltransferase [Pseudomonadota bacterium]